MAKTDVELTTKDPVTGERAVRSAETNLGDLCADAYRVMLDADVAFVNGGGVRADIPAGDITYEQIINVHPFGNEACVVETTGQDMTKFYRPPQGKYSESNLKMAQELGYKTFFWSLAYVDWYEDKQPTREEALNKLNGRIHPGAIVLLHSTSKTNSKILQELIQGWKEQGYKFCSIDNLLT